jgi:hypothetical protein
MIELMTLEKIRKIIKLSKYPISKLRKLNFSDGRLYNGKELTKEELIYQLVFYRDAPEE